MFLDFCFRQRDCSWLHTRKAFRFSDCFPKSKGLNNSSLGAEKASNLCTVFCMIFVFGQFHLVVKQRAMMAKGFPNDGVCLPAKKEKEKL